MLELNNELQNINLKQKKVFNTNKTNIFQEQSEINKQTNEYGKEKRVKILFKEFSTKIKI